MSVNLPPATTIHPIRPKVLRTDLPHVPTARTFAIGDIHGCSLALAALVDVIQPNQDDLVVLLGDYVDRGPDSRGVIEQIFHLRDQTNLVALSGNHELMMLAACGSRATLGDWLLCGGDATLASYGGSLDQVPAEHLDFLRSCQPYFETKTHIFVHANYVADTPLCEQSDYFLFWEHITRSFPGPHRSGKVAILGHTPQAGGAVLDAGHVICIDTYCCGDGWLTAMELGSKQIWQANKAGILRSTTGDRDAGM